MPGKRFDGVNATPWQPVTVPTVGIPPGAELSREQPARPAGIVADLIVPLGQSAVTGALVAGVIALALGALTDWRGGDLLQVWAGLALAITAAVWCAILGQTRRLLWSLEILTGRDWDNDGATGKPAERLVVVGAQRAAAVATVNDAAERRSQFEAFVLALPIRGTAERTWAPILGRDTYLEYRTALFKCGWAKWSKQGARRKEAGGWELTTTPEAILERVQ